MLHGLCGRFLSRQKSYWLTFPIYDFSRFQLKIEILNGALVNKSHRILSASFLSQKKKKQYLTDRPR